MTEVSIETAAGPRDEALGLGEGTALTSAAVRALYTETYYLQDCEGHETFSRTTGRQLLDSRLRAVLELANIREPGRVLDVGCGRGELAYQFARLGAEVTAIDYSPAAITLAHRCFAAEPALRRRTTLLCASVFDAPLQGEYDAVVAADLVEHLSARELDRLYSLIAGRLSEGGVFVVHTYPNKWLYQYEYARRLRASAARGIALPADPRSHYERELHINEQSPRVLRRQLSRCFPEVRLWFGASDNPGGSLRRRYSTRECAAAPDLFAVASNGPIHDDALMALWEPGEFTDTDEQAIEAHLVSCPETVEAGSRFRARVVVQNHSGVRVSSCPPNPVHLSYHWHDPVSGSRGLHDGLRTGIVPSIGPGTTRELEAEVQAPDSIGPCVLQVRLVQEGVRWFPAGPDADREVLVATHRDIPGRESR